MHDWNNVQTKQSRMNGSDIPCDGWNMVHLKLNLISLANYLQKKSKQGMTHWSKNNKKMVNYWTWERTREYYTFSINKQTNKQLLRISMDETTYTATILMTNYKIFIINKWINKQTNKHESNIKSMFGLNLINNKSHCNCKWTSNSYRFRFDGKW